MTVRKFIKKLHLYVALALCLPLVIQGLTGSILVFQNEISHALLKRNHVFLEGEIRDASFMIKAASTAVEKDFKVNLIKISDVASVRFIKIDGEKKFFKEVILDPVSLEILAVKNPENDFLRIIKKFHATLLLQPELGHNIVSILGFSLLFLTISGMILWFPKIKNLQKKNAFTFTFKFSSIGKKFQRDLHVAFGFWSCIFLFLTAFSGIYLTLPEGTGRALKAVFVHDDLAAISSIKVAEKGGKKTTLDEAIRISQAEVGETSNLVALGLPMKSDQPYRFNFAAENTLPGTPSTVILFDQYQGKIIAKRDPKNLKTADKLMAWQHAIHTGEWFGLTSKIINFIIGFLPILFSITGIMMWLIKKRQPR